MFILLIWNWEPGVFVLIVVDIGWSRYMKSTSSLYDAIVPIA